MNEQPNDSLRQTEVSSLDRRKWTRFGSDADSAMVHVDADTTWPAFVLDESFGGMGLCVPSESQLEIHQMVEIELPEGRGLAQIKHIEQFEEGAVRVGLEWKLPDPGSGASDWSTGLFLRRRRKHSS